MTKKITITVTAPCQCTDQQFEEWVKYCLGLIPMISTENPLHKYDLVANDSKF